MIREQHLGSKRFRSISLVLIMLLSSLAAIDFAGAAFQGNIRLITTLQTLQLRILIVMVIRILQLQRIIHIELQFSGMMDLEILQKEQMFGYLIHLEGTQIGQISHLQIKLKLKIMQMDLQISLSGKLIYHLINLHNRVM